MKSFRHTLMLAVALLLASFAAMSLDLPVKRINGKVYYYYIVKKGDTLYSLSNKFGITRDQLVQSNPSAADILKAGDCLYFPFDEFRGSSSDTDVEPAVEETAERGIKMHIVKKGETLYGISRQYDVDQESIVALNPSARYGVKAGATLKIPVGDVPMIDTPDEEPAEEEVKPIEFTAELTPVRPPIAAVEETEWGSDEDSCENGTSSIVVMLPFMLDSESPSRQALLYTDFYKGLMIAADTLSNRGDTVRIYAFDTCGDMDRVRQLLSRDEVMSASVIVAPDDEAQIAEIAGAVNEGTYVLNVFNVKDSTYVSNRHVLQANIPHQMMYAKAIDALEAYYKDYTPVILSNETGRNEKAEFIDMVKAHYAGLGVSMIELSYDGALVSAKLNELPDDGSRYLLIPSSGTLAEFNKFSHAVKSARDMSADPSRFEVFGYPDWTAFRGDAEEMLHSLGATIYSRFYDDQRSLARHNIDEAFMRWYGRPMMEVVPNQGMLGFDIGNLLIRNLRSNDGRFNPDAVTYVGAQSSFRFERSCADDRDDCGYCNDEIYIIRFMSDGHTERLPL